ncbi:MAG: hypothetical protein A3F35_01570 [Candidatus Woykebacteria bacterium RIFCSPHIGHO2_12_FULL_45_10]|uniref:DNA replication and repair protein RecF n=1 Tax=Candidatus Woykebacteria bacterium RIFCSPHIGHO2_12_FULL_45_10 TaxID=1802603 RepID=A0A1G1WPU2_9BACT|nr:MAG: hypothetical protein A3F35_01570 [Candidatus Woykebacteria bacterium RIFCSPHIGHO2_12_FULL_45_10]
MLEKLELVNFRNLKNNTLTLKSGLNVFYGNNAQGKTNLLEAVYLLSSGKSFRAETDKELISWGHQEAKIAGTAPPLQIELEIKEGGKKLRVNRQAKRLIELIGEFLVVLFAPEDLLIVTGPPNLRRGWLNSFISKIDKNYLFNLAKFTKLLKIRNSLLAQKALGRGLELGVWNKQLVELGILLWFSRRDYLGKINEQLKTLSPKLGAELIYLDSITQIKLTDQREAREDFEKKLAALEREEIRRAQSLIGPHRDDFKIIFEQKLDGKIVSKDVGIYGSRGEQRAAVLSLKLAETEIIEDSKGKKPTLLLDDVLSEFDREHREMIQKLLYRQQSLVTTTSLGFLEKKLLAKANIFYVERGACKAVVTAQGGGKGLSV